MPITTALLGLNPDFDRRRVSEENKVIDRNHYYTNSSVALSLKNNFFLNSETKKNEDCLIDSITSISCLNDNWNNFGTKKISSEIIINSLKIIQSIPPSLLNYLRPENIYPSKTGTIVMDWEIDKDNILSLEIAKKSVGYFVEVNGNDFKQVDNIDAENIPQIVSSINNDLSILI
ncbi:hypothetical protein [uncultured Flavobacterium sp.]|uniref:hypothetical protein n=1 Tax=uncultured Flavobacterium sp. TaxID=165435 RepID=UPI0030EF91FD|tara:strand:+ start:41006 stop:41530 length:525 start_codon:yes stop_codon:yes gene_type:complete